MAEATYILMHRDVETVRFAYDLDAHEVSKVLSVPCAAHAPIAIVDVLGRVSTFKLNRCGTSGASWLPAITCARSRAIPASTAP